MVFESRVDAKQAKLNDVQRNSPETCTQRPGWKQENKHTPDVEGASGSILRDKLGEMFTLHIHYANEDFFSALPSRNHHAVNGNYTGDYVVVPLQTPQAKLCLLPGRCEVCKFSFWERNDLCN